MESIGKLFDAFTFKIDESIDALYLSEKDLIFLTIGNRA